LADYDGAWGSAAPALVDRIQERRGFAAAMGSRSVRGSSCSVGVERRAAVPDRWQTSETFEADRDVHVAALGFPTRLMLAGKRHRPARSRRGSVTLSAGWHAAAPAILRVATCVVECRSEVFG